MEEDPNNTDINNSSYLKEPEAEKTLVGKFKEIISNTPLSKWFRKQNDSGSTVRRRDESHEDEEFYSLQPPTKRSRLPTEPIFDNTLSPINPVTTKNCLNSVNNISKKVYVNNFPEPVAGPSGINTRKLLNTNVSTSISVSSVRNASNAFKSKLSESNKDFDIINKDSDSEESTSGYSSVARIGSKEQVCGSQDSSKQTSPLESSPNKTRSLFQTSGATSAGRSLFTERSLSPKMNSSLSSRQPCFNASPFGSHSNLSDKASLASSRKIVNSPFYSGRTIYGGASAYGSRHLNRSSQDLSASLRNTVKIKPVNNKNGENGNVQLGKTARRILDTLEQYSSPVNDAKKIPVSSRKVRKDGLVARYVGANPYLMREGNKTASNKELQVPSVTDLLKMKKQNLQKSRLQDSTEAVRQLATHSNSTLNVENYKIATENEQQEKHTGKMKTKISSVRHSKVQLEENLGHHHNDAMVLNPVALPIKNLPKFDLGSIGSVGGVPAKEIKEKPTDAIKKPSTTPSKNDLIGNTFEPICPIQPIQSKKNILEISENNNRTIQSNKNMLEFKFSAPIILAENFKAIVAANNFKFSEPLCKKRRNSNILENNSNKTDTEPLNKVKNNGDNSMKLPNIFNSFTKKDEQKSLMDKFRPAEGTWECPTCMIRNQADKSKCVACETPKTTATSKEPTKSFENKPFPTSLSSGFGDKFKTPAGTWECAVCMIRNKSDATKCAACETPKQDAGGKTTASSASQVSKLTNSNPTFAGFGGKFAPPPSTWECQTCMIRNKEEVTKCVACETPRPGTNPAKCGPSLQSAAASFGSSFKKKEDEWECSVCMVRNKANTTKCQCCETTKPGSGSASKPSLLGTSVVDLNNKPSTTFAFGIDKATASSFTFGIPPTANKIDDSKTNKTTGPTPAAVFGASISGPPAVAVTSSAPVASFSFGVPVKAGAALVGDEKKPSENTKDAVDKKGKDEVGGKSAAVVSQSGNPLLKEGEKLPEKAVPAAAGFSFGLTATTQSSALPAKPIFSATVTSASATSLPSQQLSTASPNKTPPTINFKPSGNVAAAVTSSTSPNVPPMFNFGAKPAVAASGGFGSKQSTAALPNLGVSTQASKSSDVATPIFSFGSTSTNSPKFGTISSTTSSSTVPTAASPKVGVFGSSVPPSNPLQPGAGGGVLFNSSSTPATNNLFGASSGAISSSSSNFGNNNPTTTQQGKLFSFGATPVSSPAASSLEPASKKPSFSFGQPADQPEQQISGGFNFGAAASSGGSFNFGPKPATAVNHATPTFGSTQNSTNSIFGSGGNVVAAAPAAQNGLFNFGSAAGASGSTTGGTAQKAGFSFGSAMVATNSNSSNQPQQSSTGGFNFGAAGTAAPTPGGFNFTSPGPPAFNANAKPSFNFSGGNNVTTFSAPPPADGQLPQVRKIKKAVRRTTPR